MIVHCLFFHLVFNLLASSLRQKISFSSHKYKILYWTMDRSCGTQWLNYGIAGIGWQIGWPIGRPTISTTPDNQELSHTMPLTRQHKPADMRSSHIWHKMTWFGLSGRIHIDPLRIGRTQELGRSESCEVCISSWRWERRYVKRKSQGANEEGDNYISLNNKN